MTSTGIVKSFNGGKGYGFITQDQDGTDVFVHERDCGGASPQAGDQVSFDTEASPSKPGTCVAKNVTGCTGTPEGKGGKGCKGGGKAQGTGQFQGTVKSFVEAKGYGFITHQGEGDVFFHQRDIVDESVADRGDLVRYDLEANPAKPGTMKATNVTGGSKGKGHYKGKDSGGKGMDNGKGGCGGKGDYGKGPMVTKGWGADPWAGDAWGPYGGGGKGWGGDAWGAGKGGDTWGCGGKGGDAWGCGGKGKGW